MSDFHQPGLICTLQRLAGGDAEKMEETLVALSREKPVTLVLPCHFSEIGKPALDHILDEISQVKFLREIIVSMNGMDAAGFSAARKYFARLTQSDQPHRILWNDGPALGAVYRRLTDAGLGAFVHGKGFNVWAAFGIVFAEGKSEIVVTQDCDVASFRRDMLSRLCFAALHPDLGYDYSKMYYSRVTDRIYGRVSRLFLTPLLHALVRVTGHHPLLDFLLSFRYPLSGECALRRDLAGSVSLCADWGLEIGLLCEVFRQVEPARVCQVDGGGNYDHKHQPLGAGAGADSGLYKMARQIARALFTHLIDEGIAITGAFLPAAQSSYHRESRDALLRYRNLALINGLPFDTAAEQHAIELFSKALAESTNNAVDSVAVNLASWKRVQEAIPDFGAQFLSIIAMENH